MKFLQEQDQFGQSVEFSYKKKTGYGTVLGGTCSLMLTIFFALFMGIQFFAWLFKPDFNQQTNRGYIPRGNNETYTIKTSDFLPGLIVLQNYDQSEENWDVNNQTNWNVTWIQTYYDAKTDVRTDI